MQKLQYNRVQYVIAAAHIRSINRLTFVLLFKPLCPECYTYNVISDWYKALTLETPYIKFRSLKRMRRDASEAEICNSICDKKN